MKFKNHAFISYGHIDDETTSGEEVGWVTRFHNDLATYLGKTLGEEAEVWLDHELRGNDIFAQTIVAKFPQTATLVSILSARYLKSEWCNKEVEAFCAAVQKQGGVAIGDKSRVLKVMLMPIASSVRAGLAAPLRDAIGYEFYQETEGEHFLYLDPKFGEEQGQAYHRKVLLLAEDVAKIIQQMEDFPTGASQPTAAEPQPSRPVVYLAECSYDCAADRQKLRDELRTNGYTVLPEAGVQLPELDVDYVSEVTALLSQCQLSVHLVGNSPGKMPDGKSGKSAVQLQNDVAAQMSADRKLPRIIWLPSRTASDQPVPNSAFIDQLTRNSELQKGADLIVGDVEELKSAVRTLLKNLERPVSQPVATAEAGGSVNVICLADDMDAVSPIAELISSQGRTVDLPVFSGDAAEVRCANEAFAMKCDAVVLFCGAGDGAWIFHQQNELNRIAGLRRNNPWRGQFTVLAGPATGDKRAMVFRRPPGLLNIMDGFALEKLKPLFDALHFA
jgi:hypothetical protein